MSNHTKKLHDLHPLRLLPLVLCLAMVAFFIIRGGITVEDILNYCTANCGRASLCSGNCTGGKYSGACHRAIHSLRDRPLFGQRTCRSPACPPSPNRRSDKKSRGALPVSFVFPAGHLSAARRCGQYVFRFHSGALSYHFAGRAAGRFAQSACRHPAGRQRLAGRFACLLGRPRHHRRCFGDLAFGLSAMAKGAEGESIKMIRWITLRKGEPLQERASPYFCFLQIRPLSNRWANPLCYFTRSSQNATALAAATFSESTPCCMGIRTV